MPNIILGQKPRSGTLFYQSGDSFVNVKKETNYKPSKIFHRFVHEPRGRSRGFKAEEIKIYKGIYDFRRCLTLTTGNGYKDAKLECVDVYFNQYDPEKTPLLFVLHFKNGEPPAQNRYYKRSDFEREISRGATKKISDLNRYDDENSILCDLIKETDRLNEPITYNIGEKGDDSRNTYNGDKIKVEDDSSDLQLTSSGFKRYKHTPLPSGRGKKACVIYRGNALLKKDGKEEVEGIQGLEYTRIRVYFGDKAKVKSNGSTSTGSSNPEDVPLLIELVKKGLTGRPGEPEYYVHKRNGQRGDNYYWEKLTGETGSRGDSGNTLKDLLEDIGLNTSSSGRGYDTLQSLLRSSGILGGSEGELSGQLKQATGSRLQRLLQQKVNGSKTLLQCLLERVQFNIVDSVVILVEKKGKQYGDGEIQGAIKTLDPTSRGTRINVLKVNGDNGITVSEETSGGSGTCIQKYKYKVWSHDIGTLVTKDLKSKGQSAGIRFLIPSNQVSGGGSNSGGIKYRELSLYNVTGTGDTGPQNLEYKYYTKNGGEGEGTGDNSNKVYVVFYSGEGTGVGQGDTNNVDPRPLLLCYNNNAYIPRNKASYNREWVKVKGVKNCVCPPPDRGDTLNQPVLNALTKVVGFLNTVELSKHPGKCGEGSPGSPGPATNTCTDKNGKSTCTYEVHQYNGKPVKINVECENVNESSGQSCYRKLVHTPAGLEGKGTGFRLGDIIHTTNTNKVDYFTHSPEHKYKPLQKVTAYFYNQDKQYKDPLLVELEFKNGVGSSGDKEYYRLQPSSDGTKLVWQQDLSASEKVKGNGAQLAKHLDEIRYGIKKVLKLEIDKQVQYPAKWSKNVGDTKSGFTPVPNGPSPSGKQIQVTDCTKTQCTALSGRNYKCFQHKITEGLGDKLNEIGGIALTLPSETGENNPIELKLHNGDGGCQNGNEPIEQLVYNSCMGDVYVFFYNKGGGGDGNSVDSVPLMVLYNKNYYKPENRDNYFTKWVCVSQLVEQASKVPCGEDNGAILATELDKVNRSLNVIDLFDIKTNRGKDSSYGLPQNKAAPSFSTERVKVTTKAPTSKYAKEAYTRVVHRTKNGFQIGEIKYNKNDITTGGIQVPNGGEAIKIANGTGGENGNHKSLVDRHKWNTVVCYYSNTDGDKKLPQLIVILKTDNEAGDGQDVKGARDTQYGYYILTKSSTRGSGSGYEYKWVNVSEPGSSPVTLNDATDFTLLNSVVILLDKQDRSGYNDGQISAAVRTAIQKQGTIKSPGQEDDVNRLTGEKITIQVADGTGESFLKDTGFKLITHDISSLVNLNPSLSTQLKGVTLIGGLRFLIPTHEKEEYRQMKLYDEKTNGFEVIKYHQSIGGNKINVFFYNEDPRPLLLCYAGSGYKPTNKGNYFDKWHKVEKISKCDCQKPNCEILKSIVEVSNFLNPLDIKIVPKYPKTCKTYFVHFFNGKGIKIKVDFKPSEGNFCYHRYTHTHCGTGKCKKNGKVDCKNSGKGFRLGKIEYGCDCIKLNGGTRNATCITSVLDNGNPPGKHKSADQVVVFYYKHDKDHENPLMVVLCGSDEKECKLYYTLKEKGKKDYKKNESEIDLTNNKTLGEKLDEVLFKNNKKLQIILSERPKPIKLCPEDYKENCNDLNCLKGNNCDKQDKILKQLQCKLIEELKDNKTISDSILYHVPEKMCYQAQLYKNDGSEVQNGNGKSHYNIGVEEMKCDALTSRGYRCLVHKLTEVEGIEEVGGLKLYLWANQGANNGKEIELHDIKITMDNIEICECGQDTEKVDPVTYNTCKGNLYVYFYGDDPRPLLLCYAGNAYKPKDKGSYEKSWVCAPGVKCQCGEEGFEATNVLEQLYELSMFLNEVRLEETKSAFTSRDQPASHKYPVHTYNKTTVYVSVTGTDLSCYKQYTHMPEKGYRLGNICYNTESSSSATESRSNGDCKGQCTPATGINYAQEKQLISVSLYYYMYDKDHNWPLIVELGYKGELSEFYRLNDPGKGSKENGKTEKKWEKMTDKPDDVGNGKHSCKNQQNGANNVQKDEKCQLDAEFAKQAKELQKQIYKAERGIPWDQRVYWYRVIELEELIERRAYRIRKSLKLEYEKESDRGESNLILKTDKDCHEESVMGYVIGGGAVGVVY